MVKRNGRQIGNILPLSKTSFIKILFLVSLSFTVKTNLLPGLTDPPTKDTPAPQTVVAYSIAVTACQTSLLDAAAVLKQSIQLSSRNSHYKPHMIAFVHEDAEPCSSSLQALGYEIRPSPSPVSLEEIRNPDYAKIIRNSGCCGEKEFIKLYAYTLTDYPIVVQLDIDTLVLKQMDPLLDAMLLPKRPIPSIMWPNTTGETVHAFFTRDYNQNGKKGPRRPPNKIQVQGAFLIVRPNREVFEEYLQLIKNGQFVPGKGWGDQGWGGVQAGQGGSDRFQGIVSYYYSGLHPDTAVELNPCHFNQNAGKPRQRRQCTTTKPEEDCEDCRLTNLSDIVSVHFGGCRKPWECPWDGKKQPQRWSTRGEACKRFHREWHRVRRSLDGNHRMEEYTDEGTVDAPDNITAYYYGHCVEDVKAKFGYRYIPMKVPRP